MCSPLEIHFQSFNIYYLFCFISTSIIIAIILLRKQTKTPKDAQVI
jgi:hypothetical protein